MKRDVMIYVSISTNRIQCSNINAILIIDPGK